MKLKTLLIYALSIIVVLSILSGCALQSRKEPTPLVSIKTSNNATTTANATTATLSTNTTTVSGTNGKKPDTTSGSGPIGGLTPNYDWNYNLTITNYENGQQLNQTTFSVQTGPQGGSITLPGELFPDGSSRTVNINQNDQATLYNNSTQQYESVSQNTQQALSSSLQSFSTTSSYSQMNLPITDGFTLEKTINGDKFVYSKTSGNTKCEMTVNEYNIPEQIDIYNNGFKISSESIQTAEEANGIYLPTKITITRNELNESDNSNVQLVSDITYDTTLFEKVSSLPPVTHTTRGDGK